MSAQVWVVGAGKGGVGKTFVSSCLGITLTKMNHSALLIDFDLTGANIHTTLGLPLTQKNLHSYLTGQEKLAELIQPTPIPRLSYVQGNWDSWVVPDISLKRVQHTIEESKKLPFDFVIIDLGSGATEAHLEFFKQATERILVTNAEPTAIEKTYRFIEAYLCHTSKENMNEESFGKLLAALKKYRQTHPKGHFSFRNYLNESTGLNLSFLDQLNKSPVRLILNESRSRQDQDLGFSIKSVSQKYFDFRLDYLGAVDFDNAVWQSIKTRDPVLVEKPFTPLSGQFLTICRNLLTTDLHSNLYRAVV